MPEHRAAAPRAAVDCDRDARSRRIRRVGNTHQVAVHPSETPLQPQQRCLDLAPVDHVRGVRLGPERTPQLPYERPHLRYNARHPARLCRQRAKLRLLHHAALALEEGVDDRSNLHDLL
eukprot:9566240-Heterocapsa_arctica.AAC.1